MKKIQTFGLIGLLTSSAFAVANGTEREVLDNWRQAISTSDFNKTLTSVKSLKEDWPAIHSVKHTVSKNEEKALVQADYRNVARAFLQGLESYERELQEMPPEAFCEGADALLDARKKFLKYPSYINYFLVDAINRIIYVNLGERLAKVGDVPMCYDKIVGRLADFRCDLSKIANLVSEEYGANKFSMTTIENLPLGDKLNAIGKVIGQDRNFLFIPQDMHNMYGPRILEKQSLTALSHRLALSDHFIGASLPALLSYRRKATNFTPTDSWEQIRIVLRDEPRLPPTLLYGEPPSTASIADDFLSIVRSENWRNMLCFFDVLKKETLSTLEKEEAERETKRETEEK